MIDVKILPEEIERKRKIAKDAQHDYLGICRDYLLQCLEEAGMKDKIVIPKKYTKYRGKLVIDFKYDGYSISFRRIKKDGTPSVQNCYVGFYISSSDIFNGKVVKLLLDTFTVESTSEV